MFPKPANHFLCITVRRKHGIEHFDYRSMLNNQRKSLDKSFSLYLEYGKGKRLSQFQIFVTQQLEGQMESLNGLLLVIAGLSTDSKYSCAQCLEFVVMISEGA